MNQEFQQARPEYVARLARRETRLTLYGIMYGLMYWGWGLVLAAAAVVALFRTSDAIHALIRLIHHRY